MKDTNNTGKMSKRAVAIFKAFSDDNRIQIVELLKNGETSAAKLLEELLITQPTLSHHMKILCDAGLVLGRRNGRWTQYSLVSDGLDSAVEYLMALKMAKDSPSMAGGEVG